MIESSDAKEIKNDYLEILSALIKTIFQKAKEKEFNPSKELSISVGGERIYRGQIENQSLNGINPFISKDLVDKLNNAISHPEQLKNVVSIKVGKSEVFRVEKGETKIDKLGLSQAVKQSQKNVTPERTYNVEALQKQVDVLQKKIQEQQKLIDDLKTQPQSLESINKLFAQVEEMSKSLEKQQKAIEKTQQSLLSFSEVSLPRIQNTKLQNWVGGIENKFKQTSRNLWEQFQDLLTPKVVKLRRHVDQQIFEIKSQINQHVDHLKNELQTQVSGIKSQIKTSVAQVRESVDNKIAEVKQKAIEESVLTLLQAFGERQSDGSIAFKTTNFNFQQKGETVNVWANSNGAEVIKDGVITPSVTAEQITQLEKIKPVVDEYLTAQADWKQTEDSYLEAEKQLAIAESEYLSNPENLQDSESLSTRGMSR